MGWVSERARRSAAAAVVVAGAAAGVVAGAAMLSFVSFATWWRGLGFLTPVQAFAGFFLGRGALGEGWGAIFLGLAVHGAVSIALGVLFTAIAFRRVGPIESVGAGVLLAAIAWAVLTYVVARFTNPALMVLAREAPLAWFGGHVVFGIIAASARQLYDVSRAAPGVPGGDELRRAAAPSPEGLPAAATRGPVGDRRAARPRVLARVAGALPLVAAAIAVAWRSRHGDA